MIKQTTETIGAIAVLIVSAIILVVLGLVFFLVNLWIIDFAAKLLSLRPLNPDVMYSSFVILSAAILSAASMIGSKREK